ncbi:MAG TPA: pyrroline-5-carboxylate reductase [Gammaproteobacteria bacterium]|nr:pyrroline-5-carboxylate reductase [Gammaproteobacteria bacterium]
MGGLIGDSLDSGRIRVADPDPAQRERLSARYGVRAYEDNAEAAEGTDVLVFAVKPQALRTAAADLAGLMQKHQPLALSIAAGIRSADLDRWLGGGTAVVRAMPNTPALVQSGATVLYANAAVSAPRRDLAESILRAVGITLWVDDESLMDAVTALSGSGPAYFFMVMEAMEAAGVELGLSPETARMLTLETAFGAAKVALGSGDDVATLRQRVTSPGGTTEAALAVLDQAGLREHFRHALRAARDRSRALAQQFGDEP